MAGSNGKDVIYVDVDDEITGIIDKVTSSDEKIVALVLPKRATVLQSIVNMKLLKKRADVAKKHLVLITAESGLMPLAGSVGVYVAKTLQSKPEIPDATEPTELPDDTDEAVAVDGADFDAKQSGDKPVGDLAAGAVGASALNGSSQMPEESIEIDNSDAAIPAPGSGDKNVAKIAADGAAGKAGKKGKDKKLRVPNFEKFRVKLILGVLAVIALIVVWILANRILPKASVTIQTDTSNVSSSLTPTLDTSASSVTPTTVPAQVEQVQKTYTAQVPATGQQNNGNKAAGTVTMSEQACAPNLGTPDPLPAGTGLSANGLTFITQTGATFNFNGFSGGSCANYSTGPVNITAQNGGSQYNLGNGTSFTVANDSSITASGSTTGGTDNIQTVVQQSDIDSAKQKAEQGISKNAIEQQLEQTLQGASEYPIVATFAAGKPQITTSSNVGDQASNVTYTENVTYIMFGAKQSDLQQLIASSVDQQINSSKQAIQDYGLHSASISVPNPGNNTKVQISMQVTSVIGPHLDEAQLKTSIEGQKAGDAQSTIAGNPGVNSVNVKLSPFWVNSVPKNPSKITITLEKSSSQNGS